MSTDPRALRTVEIADVIKGDRLAARLSRTAAGIEFAYLPEYLRVGGPAVATSLPLSDTATLTSAGAVPPFFAGLLPEGRRLTALREVLKTSLDDELTLLLAIGTDPVGDVRVVPTGTDPRSVPAIEPTVAWHNGADLSFRDLLADVGFVERRGFAGVQDKASAAMITLPASTHGREAILKLTPPEFPHLAENEAWFLGLARRAGLQVPAFRLVADRDGEHGLLVERFDRTTDARGVRRLAVEDAAQVLGLYPADKYRVTSEQVSTALIGRCQSRPAAARELFRLFAFAWLTGNGDMHAKNASIIERDDEWRIAPVYDVPSTLPYGDDSMAVTLAGRDRDHSHRAFLEFADAIELPTSAATTALRELLVATRPALEVFEQGVEPFTRSRNAQVIAALRQRRRLLEV